VPSRTTGSRHYLLSRSTRSCSVRRRCWRKPQVECCGCFLFECGIWKDTTGIRPPIGTEMCTPPLFQPGVDFSMAFIRWDGPSGNRAAARRPEGPPYLIKVNEQTAPGPRPDPGRSKGSVQISGPDPKPAARWCGHHAYLWTPALSGDLPDASRNPLGCLRGPPVQVHVSKEPLQMSMTVVEVSKGGSIPNTSSFWRLAPKLLRNAPSPKAVTDSSKYWTSLPKTLRTCPSNNIPCTGSCITPGAHFLANDKGCPPTRTRPVSEPV
jgi:hypothetical protein